ncbi:MAG: hypothetical protein J2P37_14610 [Ktedonobacteraceae bacterium]|nr:hypothetical protein [Ktedonobacteraceae bacterium]
MKQFSSIEKIDTAILYILELTSSLSVLLLAFGLIASMANVLTKGSVLTDNLIMQRIWAWTQCIAIDASVAGTIIRTFRAYAQGERVKCLLHALLSALLLFTAAIVSNIESVQQTLHVTLEAAYVHVFIPVEFLIWIRSLVIVLLIVAHALRHVPPASPAPTQANTPPSTPIALTPELVETLRAALTQVTVSQEPQIPALPAPQGEQEQTEGEQRASTAQGAAGARCDEQENSISEQDTANCERVKAYLAQHPEATDREIAGALSVSRSTVNKWRRRIHEVEVQSEHNV